MKIAFHGTNAGNFRQGFEALLSDSHEIVDLSDALDKPGEAEHFQSADVIVGIRLTAAEPKPLALRLYQAPAAGTDAIELTCLPKGATLCNAFGHEDAIAEYVMTTLLLRHVPIPRADARLREGHWDYWAGSPGALRTELGGSSIGLLGFGHIGKAIAVRAKAFGMRVTVCNRSPVAALAARRRELRPRPPAGLHGQRGRHHRLAPAHRADARHRRRLSARRDCGRRASSSMSDAAR